MKVTTATIQGHNKTDDHPRGKVIRDQISTSSMRQYKQSIETIALVVQLNQGGTSIGTLLDVLLHLQAKSQECGKATSRCYKRRAGQDCWRPSTELQDQCLLPCSRRNRTNIATPLVGLRPQHHANWSSTDIHLSSQMRFKWLQYTFLYFQLKQHVCGGSQHVIPAAE